MSKKAEEKALEAYPVEEMWVGNQYGGPEDVNASFRRGYREGYEQAEKDLALTWEDVKRIVEIADKILHDPQIVIDIRDKGEEFYYSEVLCRYNESKKEQ